MALSGESIGPIRDSIRDGTFPDSNDILAANLTTNDIPSLLAAIEEGREALSNEIREISKGQAGDVDEWIQQAKQVQDDIARCKLDARKIVEEHERVEAMRNTVCETSSRAQMLEEEIAFTKALEHEIQGIGDISQVLDQAGTAMLSGDSLTSVQHLSATRKSIEMVSAGTPRAMLSKLEAELRQKSCSHLLDMLDATWSIHRTGSQISLTIASKNMHSGQTHLVGKLGLQEVLEALTKLEALPNASVHLLRKLEAFVLSLLAPTSSGYPGSVAVQDRSIKVDLENTKPDAATVTDIIEVIVQFLHTHLPDAISDTIVKQLSPKIVLSLITNWLDVAVPYDLRDLQQLDHLQDRVTKLAAVLSKQSWPGEDQLGDWIESIPRTWLSQRRMKSLDMVRNAFKVAKGTLRRVERVERQLMTNAGNKEKAHEEDDWNAQWDAEPALADKSGTGEDDTSGWDFETEDEGSEAATTSEKVREADDDSGDAWGWGDESPVEAKQSPPGVKLGKQNGVPLSSKEHELILRETFAITDIPDQVISVVQRDVEDSLHLQTFPDSYFKSSSPLAGLQTIPVLVLAMYRATAPNYYSLSSHLSNMNLYNDTLYLIQQLSDLHSDESQLRERFAAPLDSTAKFARQIYTRELEVQRTILSDLLDGAQGFVSCTRFPYSQECTNAVAATIDRIRAVHTEWKDTLGQSHLMQSIGSLVAMVMGKITKDVEDMEDISEPESRQLAQFCQQISSLEDLFIVSETPAAALTSTVPDMLDQEKQPLTTIPLHVPNYLRFQYLAQILESSLVDIKYLWTEGELSLEFSADEVVDLIKALFTESTHRRGVINTIRGRG